MRALFRQDVIRIRALASFGGISVGGSRLAGALSLASAAFALALLAVAWFGTYASKERVAGFITPSAGLIRVAPLRPGVLLRLEVEEGAFVRAQQPLFTLASPSDASSGAEVDALVVDRLLEERASLEGQLAQERRLSDAARGDAERRLREVERQIDATAAQKDTARRRASLIEQDVARLETLRERGHVAASLLDARFGDLLESQQQVQLLEREIDRLAASRAATEAELRQVPLQFDLRAAELRNRLLQLDRTLAAAEAQWSQVVRAPVGGRIATVLARQGMTVAPDRTVLTIVPAGSRLQAELLVPTRAAGFVSEDQRVRIRYDAFPYQKFGLYGGTVQSISRTVLNPEDQIGPVRLQLPAYRVVVALDAPAVRAYGEDIALQPGLTLQADIVRDRRRIIEWLFDPVLATARGL